jgi:NDP-sugar pyrophosphorylase family protein
MPFVIMNGDLLTKVDLKSLLQFHSEHKASATMCVRGFENNIPYGVVKVDDHYITSLEEKPIQSVLVNAGIYVLEPECLDFVPEHTFFNMTTLFEKLIADKKNPAAFPIHEYWIDIGLPDEFSRADNDYFQVFERKNG